MQRGFRRAVHGLCVFGAAIVALPAPAAEPFFDDIPIVLTASRLALKTERKLRVFSETAYISLNYATKSGVIMTRTANDAKLREVREQLAAGADLTSLDYTEVVSGLQEGEQVLLMTALQMQASRDSALARMRGRGGMPGVPGAGGGGPGGGGPGRGGRG